MAPTPANPMNETVTTNTAAGGRRRRPSALARREERLGWALVAPAALIVVSLIVFPVLWNVSLSLQRIRLIELQRVDFFSFDPTFANFGRVTGIRDFWPTVRTTFVYTVFGTVLSLGMGLWAALVVRHAFRGRSLVRGLMLFPYVAPVVAVTLVWRIMLNPTFGIANVWLERLGLQRVDFLGRPSFTFLGAELPLALTVVILFEAWRYFPFAFLFILARLQAFPAELEEAAEVDGATISQKFWYIVLPQLKGVFSVLFLLRFIWTFNKFDDVFLLTGGSAGTKVVTVQIVEWLRGRADIGAAAALSLILAGILIVLLLVYFRWFYEEETA